MRNLYRCLLASWLLLPVWMVAEDRLGQLENGLTYAIYSDENTEEWAMGLVLRTGSLHEAIPGLANFVMERHIASDDWASGLSRERVSVPFGVWVCDPESEDSETSLLTQVGFLNSSIIFRGGEPETDLEQSLKHLSMWVDGEAFENMGDGELQQAWSDHCAQCYQAEYWQSLCQEGESLKPLIEGSLFHRHLPYSRPNADVEVKMEDVIHFFRSTYQPKHMGVWVRSNLEADEIEALIKTLFEDLRHPEEHPPLICTTIPTHNPSYTAVRGSQEYACIRGMYLAPREEQVQDGYRAAVVAERTQLLMDRFLQFRLEEEINGEPDLDFDIGSSRLAQYDLLHWEVQTEVAAVKEASDILRTLLRLQRDREFLLSPATEHEWNLFQAYLAEELVELQWEEEEIMDQAMSDFLWCEAPIIMSEVFGSHGEFPGHFPTFSVSSESRNVTSTNPWYQDTSRESLNQAMEKYRSDKPWTVHIECPAFFTDRQIETLRRLMTR